MDDKSKKVSLRGLGRQLMRGLNPKAEDQTQKQDQDAFFDDDEAVLNWMEASNQEPEDIAPVASSEPVEDIFADPNFDDYFAEPEVEEAPTVLVDKPIEPMPDDTTIILPKEKSVRSLDEVFADPTPEFQDVFGDVIAIENSGQKIALADPMTASEAPYSPGLQSPSQDDVVADEEPLPSWATPDYASVKTGLTDQLVWPNDPQAEQLSLEDSSEEGLPEEINPFDALAEESLPYPDDEFDDIPSTENLAETDEVPFEEHPPIDDLALNNKLGGIPTWMDEDIQQPPESPIQDSMPAPLPNSDRETAFGIGSPDEIHEGFIQAPDSFEALVPLEDEPPLTRSAAFDETTTPTSSEEAIPTAEASIRPVDLSGMKVNRPALANITPIAPEILPGGEEVLPLTPEQEEAIIPPQEFATDEILVEEDISEPNIEPAQEEIPFEDIEDILIPAPQEDEAYGGLDAIEPEAIPLPEEMEEADEPVRRTGGFLLPEIGEQPASDPFTSPNRQARRPAREIFVPRDQVSDADLLRLFVDDARLRELYSQIEAFQEQIVASVRGERGNTDTYQEELLEASNLLLQSRENYDEARAILYRVRADLAREKRVAEDISRYRPMITAIYVGMAVFFFIFMLLGPLVEDITKENGIGWFGQSYYAMVAGYLGGLLFGARTLYKHSVVDRDFDAIHLYWYVTNPILGFITGFLAYLFIWLTLETSFEGNIQEVSGRNPLVLLLGAAVGYNQNIVNGILGAVQNRFSGSSGNNSTQGQPPQK